MSDAKPDVPPPRYTEVGGWKRLICDEQEWLARPAPWGIDKLPNEVRGRKNNLCSAYRCGWLAGFIECVECRPHVRALFTDEGGFVNDAVVEGWNLDTHPSGACDADGIRKSIRNHRRGIVTHSEMTNRFWDHLFDNLHRCAQKAYREGRSLDRDRRDYERALALELVGPNPFRPISFAPEWRTDTAVALARQMYALRDFSAMPILADALQDAGCDNTDILSHCRDEGTTHVRGCWVVDLVLGLA